MFILIVVLMSVSLIGIISVQLYWIDNAVKSKDRELDNDVIKSLASTSERIAEREKDQFIREYEPIFRNIKLADKAGIKNIFLQQIDTVKKQKFTFGATILEEDFKMPLGFLDSDTVIYKRINIKKDFFQAQLLGGTNDFKKQISESRFSTTKQFDLLGGKDVINYLSDYKKYKPIHQRISNKEIKTTLKEELGKRNIDIDFKYGVYNYEGLATKLKSGYYTIDTKESYSYPLFINEEGLSDYKLFVTFPTKNKHILSEISYILLLSLFFIFIIILAFSSSLYQLVKQKKISEIKTDFINNMTHEFKTPIATINLALDSIKNPKIISNSDKVMHYVKMIRDENKRMHGQVENVLRISKLEKNQIEIAKEEVDIHDLIEDAITHVKLLVLDKKGTISTHFQAMQTEVFANQFHLTNVLVNMLENALKYSVDPPKIDVYTESTNKFFIIKIKDEGIGMTKNAQKYVFDKFYREQKGNIHNVKGHGLGLAYVKEIVTNHHGTVFVESEKGVGSIFTIKLPLI